MELRKLFKKLLNSACIIFTVITAVYMLILQIINISDSNAGIEASRVLLFFIFSVLLSIANLFLSAKGIHASLRYIIHYVISIFGFWTCFCLPNKMDFSKTFVGIIIFSACYAIVMTLIGVFSRRLKKQSEPKAKYEKQFTTKSK